MITLPHTACRLLMFDHGGTDQECPPGAVLSLLNWRWGWQVTRSAEELPEAATGEEEGSTGSSVGQLGRGLGRKRKAATGDAAAPPPGMPQRGGPPQC
jgi:hypothetical protein